MNVERLFEKRGAEEVNDSEAKRPAHSREERVLEFLERDVVAEPQKNAEYNVQWVKNSLTKLGELVTSNLQMREKHSSDPTKLMDSEFELFQGLKVWSETSIALVEAPDYQQCYAALVESPVFAEVVGLLASHPNIDVREQVLLILVDLVEEEREECRSVLGQYFTDCKIGDLLGKFLEGLDSIEDRGLFEQYSTLCLGFAITLAEFENVTLTRRNGLNDKVLEIIESMQQVDKTSQYAMEYLQELLVGREQSEIESFEKDNDADLVETLMVVWSKLRKVPISGTEMTELKENCILLLAYVLRFDAYRARFLENDGLELAMLFVNSDVSKQHINAGLKIMASVIDEKTGPLVVEMGVLKPLLKHFETKAPKENSCSPHVLRLLSQLYKFLPFGSDARIRVTNKLIHKEFAGLKKVLRLWKLLEADDSDNELNLETLALANTVLLWAFNENLVTPTGAQHLLAEHDIKPPEFLQAVDLDIETALDVEERELLTSLRDSVDAKLKNGRSEK
ncbi:hypothetical protein KL942_004799 [Ogataea angusta]|uniref:Beta-catenin-like protein 1 N-terminal domain-containing protein n=1 Tax=Pichia angusta TaxID=870730 RepID=A0ABQ7RRS6_PICAN|nr:hypothetical protein KL942_004799 [Ogataea angusta]KAG7846275.1 hypothetical protein KL940_004559 [Ogataea angusta]